MCNADIFLGFLAILFPPLPVWVKCGICSADSLINICLCVLGFIPGLIHSWYIIAKFPEQDSYDYDYEPVGQGEHRGNGGGVTYVYVHNPGQQAPPHAANNKSSSNQNYGTAGVPRPQQPRPQQGPAQHLGGGGGGEAGSSSAAGNSEGAPPPSYAAVVGGGDHKVQTQD